MLRLLGRWSDLGKAVNRLVPRSCRLQRPAVALTSLSGSLGHMARAGLGSFLAEQAQRPWVPRGQQVPRSAMVLMRRMVNGAGFDSIAVFLGKHRQKQSPVCRALLWALCPVHVLDVTCLHLIPTKTQRHGRRSHTCVQIGKQRRGHIKAPSRK